MDNAHWKDGILKLSFWGLNGGLFLLLMATLLPIGALHARFVSNRALMLRN